MQHIRYIGGVWSKHRIYTPGVGLLMKGATEANSMRLEVLCITSQERISIFKIFCEQAHLLGVIDVQTIISEVQNYLRCILDLEEKKFCGLHSGTMASRVGRSYFI